MKVSRLGVGIYQIRVKGRLQAAWLQPRTGFRAVDDTPLYWQTVQAMASRRVTAGRIIPGRSDGKRGG